MLGGRVDVHDQLDVVDVDAAGGDVGGDEDPSCTRGERQQVAIARSLRQVAVQVDRRNSRFGELLGELARLMLGAHEQDSATRARCELLHQLFLRLDTVDLEHTVCHGFDV